MAFLASALLALATTPFAGRLAARLNVVAQPRADRWHRRPTPLLGGVSLALATFLPLLALASTSRPVLTVAACAAGAFALGLLDDVRHLSPPAKLVGQVLVATALFVGGIGVEVVPIPPLAFLLTLLWVVGIMNAINLLDNMDGLAAGVAAIASAALVVAALPGNGSASLIAAAMSGAAVGFLVHNFHPARIFMGDSGSQFLGFLLAAVALLHTVGAASDVGLAIVGPLFVLAVPIFDVVLVTLTRPLAGVPVSRGGRDHSSHRLAALGLNERATVLLLYALTAVLAVVGLVGASLSPLVLPLLTLSVVGLALFGVFLSQVRVAPAADSQAPTPIPRSWLQSKIGTYARFGIEIGLDVVLLITAYYAAFAVRFEGQPYAFWSEPFVRTLPIVVGLQLLTFVLTGVYRTLWRYVSLNDAVLIFRATTVGTTAAALATFAVLSVPGLSRAVFVVDWILVTGLVVGARAFLVWLRHWFATLPREGDRRLLIVGANDHGELALRLLSRARDVSYRLVGFLDDDPGKRYRRVSGVPILGRTDDLAEIARSRQVDTVVIALPDETDVARLRAVCEELGLEHREFRVT